MSAMWSLSVHSTHAMSSAPDDTRLIPLFGLGHGIRVASGRCRAETRTHFAKAITSIHAALDHPIPIKTTLQKLVSCFEIALSYEPDEEYPRGVAGILLGHSMHDCCAYVDVWIVPDDDHEMALLRRIRRICLREMAQCPVLTTYSIIVRTSPDATVTIRERDDRFYKVKS